MVAKHHDYDDDPGHDDDSFGIVLPRLDLIDADVDDVSEASESQEEEENDNADQAVVSYFSAGCPRL